MRLTRPLNVIDIESSGTEPVTDKICSLAIMHIAPDGNRMPFQFYFNPERQLTPENIAIHGLTNEFLAKYPPFRDLAKNVNTVLTGCDMAGFGISHFDSVILDEEFSRAGITFDWEHTQIIDAGTLFKKREERSLTAALKFYCDMEHTNAHDAMGDVIATISVLEGQLKRYPDLADLDVAELAKASQMDRRVDLAGHIVLNDEGVPVFGTKRNRGVPVTADYGYANWMLRTDFPRSTHKAIERIILNADFGHPDEPKLPFFSEGLAGCK